MGSRGGVEAPRRRGSVVMPAILILLVAAADSRAAAPGYEISVGAIESDNVERVPSGGTRDTIFEQELNFTWHDQRPRLNADIDADLSHLTYVPRAFSDQVIGNFIGQVRVAVVPQRLFWNFSDNFGQGNTDPLAAVTPLTRENINDFTTGPEALLPLGGENLLDVKATYGKVTYQKSPFDNNRYGGALAFIHKLSEAVEASVNVRDERVDYSNTALNPDYAIQEAFVHFDTKGARTTLGADLGYGRAVEGGSSPGTPTARLGLSRKLSTSSTVSLGFGHEYSDAASAFQVSQVLGGVNLNTQQTVQTGGPFTTVYETAGWNFAHNRTVFGATVSHFKDDYRQSPGLNDTRTVLYANASRQLTPAVRFVLGERYVRQIFENTIGSSTQTTTDARLVWRAARGIFVSFGYSFAKWHSELASANFTENRVGLSIGYGRPAELPTGVAAPPLPHAATY